MGFVKHNYKINELKGMNLEMAKTIRLSDNLNTSDGISFKTAGKNSPVFKTRIMGGYGYNANEFGEKMFDELAFDTENQILIGGALFVLEKVFGIQSPLTVDYLNNIKGIATSGPPITEIYPKDNVVSLFGVGIGGSGDTIGSVHEVQFKEREIVDMIPFRVTDEALDLADQGKYWFKKLDQDTNKTSYFLKAFETTPVIKVLWADGINGEDGTEVEANVHNSTRNDPIEVFVEMVLKISKKDCREFFEENGIIEQARVNTIGLFNGVKGVVDEVTQEEDYKQVKAFSMLNINNEMLANQKDLTMVYRIYIA